MGKNKITRASRTASGTPRIPPAPSSIKAYFDRPDSGDELRGAKMAAGPRERVSGEDDTHPPASSGIIPDRSLLRDGRAPDPRAETSDGAPRPTTAVMGLDPEAASWPVVPRSLPIPEAAEAAPMIQGPRGSPSWFSPPDEAPQARRSPRAESMELKPPLPRGQSTAPGETQETAAPASTDPTISPAVSPYLKDKCSVSPAPSASHHSNYTHASSSEDDVELTTWRDYVKSIPTKRDFSLLLQEVRNTCREEISLLRTDFSQLYQRVEELDAALHTTNSEVHKLHSYFISQASTIRDLQRHVEDLDNRGRRNNLRIRGLKEAVGPEDLNTTLQAIFNSILAKPSTNVILLDRAHRALKPRGPTDSPRDVICRLHYYTVKEDILRAARTLQSLEWENNPIQIFPDLSWVTLQQRRLLQPLLTLLRDNDIPYRWGFPFSLTARKDGRSATLKTPEDLSSFCSTLDLVCPTLSGWEPLPILSPEPLPWSEKSTPRKRPLKPAMPHDRTPRGISREKMASPSKGKRR